MANKVLKSLTFPGLNDVYKIPQEADEYSTSATYAVGDYCIKDGVLYRCTTAITTAEAWTAAHWTATQLADEVTSQSEKIDELKSATSHITDETNLTIDVKYYYTLNGETVSNKTSGADGNRCCSSLCKPKDVFTIHGGGGNTTRLWAFTDDSGTILTRAEANAVLDGGTVTAPDGATHFYSNNLYNKYPENNYSVKQTRFLDIEIVDKKINELSSYLTGYTWLQSTSFPNASGTVDIASGFTASQYYECVVVKCKEYDIFTVTAYAQVSNRAWAFVDENGDVIAESVCPSNGGGTNVTLIAPANATYLICNNQYLKGHIGKLIKETSYKNSLCVGMQLFEKIGVIGDSISVGWAKDKNGNSSRRNTGISWVQQMARRLGCTAYNLGASGVDPVEWFSAEYEFSQYCYTQYQNVGFCDLYIIALGLNECTLGSISDINQADYTQNGNTFYGQYARIIQMINYEHPNAVVMCITEPTTMASSYDQAIRDICNLQFINAELVDLEKNYFSLFNTDEIISQKQSDGVHYTPYGYSLIAEAMMNSLNDYISKNSANFQYVGVEEV